MQFLRKLAALGKGKAAEAKGCHAQIRLQVMEKGEQHFNGVFPLVGVAIFLHQA